MRSLKKRTKLLRLNWQGYGRLLEIQRSIEWVSGPSKIDCSEEEFVVLCVVRNGALWIESFFAHYEAMGARHFFFLDNGSEDETVQRILARPNVTVVKSTLPYADYFHDFTLYLGWKFGDRKWSLTADVDELFDYPGSYQVRMPVLLGYLNAQGFDTVRTYLIDMFSETPLGMLQSRPEDRLNEKYRFCDLSDLWSVPDPFGESNEGVGSAFPFLIGGIRKTLFNTNWIYLTKHPLVFDSPLFHFPDAHSIQGAHIADFTAIFWHYKFLSNFRMNAEDILRRWQARSDRPGMRAYYQELSSYVAKVGPNGFMALKLPTAILPSSPDLILEAGVLKAGDAFRALLRDHRSHGKAHAPVE